MVGFTLENVGLQIPIYGASSHSLRARIARPLVGGKIQRGDFNIVVAQALEDISCNISPGDRLGLIGHNGAGKSTLLWVLAGVYEPTQGSILRRGRIVTLFELSQGMLDEASGIENIYARGALLGLSERDMRPRVEEILAFAELEEYADLPLRTYSSGMRLRLAFSICTSVEAEIALLDEVVGAGDERFVEKAQARLRDFVQRAGIVVIATHGLEMIHSMCTRAIVLRQGKMMFDGDVEAAIEKYHAYSTAQGAPGIT